MMIGSTAKEDELLREETIFEFYSMYYTSFINNYVSTSKCLSTCEFVARRNKWGFLVTLPTFAHDIIFFLPMILQFGSPIIIILTTRISFSLLRDSA